MPLLVEDTVFFFQNQAGLLIYNQTDKSNLTFETKPEKLSLVSIRSFFMKRRTDYEIKFRFT